MLQAPGFGLARTMQFDVNLLKHGV